jgi:outer membrane protein
MKNLSLILNIVLLLAVGYLFYSDFAVKKKVAAVNFSGTTVKKNDSTGKHSGIAYVELDSLNENITYFKQRRKELEQQQKSIEADLANDYKSLEAKQNTFYQKNPNANPEDIQNLRLQLAQGQQEIENKKQTQMQLLQQKSFELMEYIQKNLKEFLADYNKEKKYQYILTSGSGIDWLIYKDSTLDITQDVITGMNEKLKALPKQ